MALSLAMRENKFVTMPCLLKVIHIQVHIDGFVSCLHLPIFRSQAAGVSEKPIVFTKPKFPKLTLP